MVINYYLYSQCHQHITLPNGKKYLNYTHFWTDFLWTLPQKKYLHQLHGDMVWILIPLGWRYCWIGSTMSLFKNVYGDITVEKIISFAARFYNILVIGMKEYTATRLNIYYLPVMKTFYQLLCVHWGVKNLCIRLVG